MAIVRATSYTRKIAGAKATIRYITHRPGREGERLTRELFGRNGRMKKSADYSVSEQLTASRETHTRMGHVTSRRLSPSRRISKAAA
jgi:hypothetical protein